MSFEYTNEPLDPQEPHHELPEDVQPRFSTGVPEPTDGYAEPGIVNDDFDYEAGMMSELQLVTDTADAIHAERYAQDPARLEAVQSQTDLMLNATAILYQFDKDTDPAVPELRTAYERLCFAFTNPQDYGDRLSEQIVMADISTLWQELRLGAAEEPVLQQLATVVNRLSAFYATTEGMMREDGELEGFSADDCYRLVTARVETILSEHIPLQEGDWPA